MKEHPHIIISNRFCIKDFAATFVDDSPIDNVAKATWLWREKTTDGTPLISDVSFDPDTFTASDGKGNAVIAGLNDEGTVVWVWHIWLTDMPSTNDFGNGSELMDRNLGAISAKEEDGRTLSLKQEVRASPLTLVFFNNPDCEGCQQLLADTDLASVEKRLQR